MVILDKQIADDLKTQRKELKVLIKESQKKGIDVLNYQETEDYGFYLGRLEMINEILEKYSKKK